jgi:glyoxylase-like metal-dependent hydrolase (beta-lactamase superfamily II)
MAKTDNNVASPFGTGRVVDSGILEPGVLVVRTGSVNFYVVSDGTRAVAFNAGTPSVDVPTTLAALGCPVEDVHHVFLSSTDAHHTGNLPLLQGAQVYLGAGSPPLERKERRLRQAGIRLRPRAIPHREISEDHSFVIGDIKVEVLETGGVEHGHLGYLVNEHLLFAGDALRVRKGTVVPPPRFRCRDYRLARVAFSKLTDTTDASIVLTTQHGAIRW